MATVSPYRTTLDQGNAYWMARLSNQIYQCQQGGSHPDEAGILNNLSAEDPGFLSVKGISKKSAQAALVEHEHFLALVFRGTDEIPDWLDNLNVFSQQALFGAFHGGFLRSVLDIWDELFVAYRVLNELKPRGLFLTGHSLGGALATVASSILIHQDEPFTSTYTFGQPRVASRDTARIYNSEAKHNTFRFQNNNDIVTRAPARIMGYSHVGKCLYITHENQIHQDPGRWMQFLDTTTGTIKSLKEEGIDAVKDHGMLNYLNAIRDWNFVKED
ncbi:lipase family protein [Cyanobium sp. N.Huapi 1H5]|nr:lipase family protein [Cyanobium sp. N.Huapi 1H5]